MKAIINGVEFNLHPGIEYSYIGTLELYIEHDSVDEIVDAIGELATVSIPGIYVGTDLVLNYIRRTMDSGDIPICETVFKPVPVRDIVNSHSEDIEVISQAIAELAEIIGGDE